MGHITWDQKYSVEVELLDGQHQLLFKIINRFYDAMERQESTENLDKLFGDVLDYTSIHFQVEESLMRLGGYPDLEQHMEAHKKLVEQAVALHSDIKIGSKSAGPKAMEFLRNWLEKHIMGVDKKYAPYISDEKLAKKRSA